MNSKERVYACITGKKIDRLPRYIWVGSAIAPALCEYYGVTKEELDNRIGNDVKQTWLSINREMERACEPGEQFVDEWGITWERQGYYNAVVHHPMKGLSLQEIENYPVADVFAPDRFAAFDRLMEEFGETHFIGADVSGTIFEPAFHLRSMEQLLVDMAAEEPEADAILDKVANQSKAIALEAVRRGADWIWLGDDMGTQKNMIMSLDMWRQYFKPRMKEIIDSIRAVKPGMIIAYHSCGAVSQLLPELIEIGINVINPLQESADNMDHNEIRALFGNQTTMFCGLDTQTFLRTASPGAVKAATTDMLNRIAVSGPYICGVSHTIQPDIPLANIGAMVEAMDAFSNES